MPLKNYRSTSTKLFTDIQNSLVKHRCKSISFDYDEDGKITGLGFGIEINGQVFMVKMPARVENVAALLKKQRVYRSEDQAYQTAWANIRDWIDAQLALVETQMVKIEEVFLPYFVSAGGKTLFEHMESDGFKRLGSGKDVMEGEIIER